jgi:hypothetical protein
MSARPRRKSATSRQLSFAAKVGICAGLLMMTLLVRDAWVGLLPVPAAGVGVAVAALACYALEKLGRL